MSTVGARLAELRQSLGWSQEQMAERLGIAPRTYQSYERDETEPKFQILRPLVEIGGDPTWLVTGETRASSRITGSQQQSMDWPLSEIPLYEAKFSAGKGKLPPPDERQQWVKLPEEWVRKVTGRNPRNLIIAVAEGDSMAPTIGDGAELLIDKTDDRLANGKIYALNVDGLLIVKRVHRPVKGGIVLISDNKEYPAEEISSDSQAEIQIIGQVVWSGRNIG